MRRWNVWSWLPTRPALHIKDNVLRMAGCAPSPIFKLPVDPGEGDAQPSDDRSDSKQRGDHRLIARARLVKGVAEVKAPAAKPAKPASSYGGHPTDERPQPRRRCTDNPVAHVEAAHYVHPLKAVIEGFCDKAGDKDDADQCTERQCVHSTCCRKELCNDERIDRCRMSKFVAELACVTRIE